MYCKRTWLNKDNSPSLGNVVAFNGEALWEGKKIDDTFLSISDCFQVVKLQRTEDDTHEEFIDKMKLLRNEIDKFIIHLENNIQDEKKRKA